MRTILNIVGQYLVISIEENSTGDALHLSLIYWCKLLELVAKEKRVLEMVGNFRDLYNFSNGVKKLQNFKYDYSEITSTKSNTKIPLSIN